jgi:Tfp pilus assembly protein PilF
MNLSHAMMERAMLLVQKGKRDEASDLLARILLEDPSYGSAWAIRGQLEQEAGRMFNAALHYNAAVQIKPDQYELWCNRGLVYAELGMTGIAEESFHKSLDFKDNPSARINLGNLFASQMMLDIAETHYRAAIDLNPADAQPHASLGRLLIAAGQWSEGWQEYRHRFGAPTYPIRAELPYPLWRGEPIDGKTILLYSEQGYGDEILSLRFCATLKQMGARVVLAVRLPMFRLARTMADVDEVIVQFDRSKFPIDYCCALLDVPAHTGMQVDQIPCAGGYVMGKRDDTLVLPEGFRVGICWRTGERPLQPETQIVHIQNTIPLDHLAPLARPGVVLVSLQKQHKDAAAVKELGIIDPMAGVVDFADTAWVMEHLDMVVSVDTSVAHLAGAMGKPTATLLRHNVIWPWMQEDGPTHWYKNTTLYRQPRHGEWKEPLLRLMADFEDRLAVR